MSQSTSGKFSICLFDSVPEDKGAVELGHVRPITLSSVITETFHQIFANKLKVIKLDERQRAS